LQIEPRKLLLLQRDVQAPIEEAITALAEAAFNLASVEEESELLRDIAEAASIVKIAIRDIEDKCR
jgi:hypothetical protein